MDATDARQATGRRAGTDGPAPPRSPGDVTVIGGGPAGSTAALLLARWGFSVTLIEQRRFPRDKVCGECLSALGFDVLDRCGLADRFLAAGAVRLTHAALHPPSGKAVRLALPRPICGLSRAVMDSLLLEAARGAGVEILQPARCESMRTDQRGGDRGLPAAAIRGFPILSVRDLSNNVVETSAPAWVVVADGKAALGRAGDGPPAATGDFGIKAHFRHIDGPRDAIELFSCPAGTRGPTRVPSGTYGGLAAIEGDRWNAAFSVPAAMLREHRGDVGAVFARVIESNPSLRRRLARAERVGPWLASPLPRFPVAPRWPERVIPVGNAAAALEPIGGEGMGLALRSAELAAGALAEAIRDGEGWGEGCGEAARSRLARAYNALWRARRAACRAAAVVASSRRAADMAAELLRHDRRLGTWALGWIGKG